MRPLVVRRCNRCWDVVPRASFVGEHLTIRYTPEVHMQPDETCPYRIAAGAAFFPGAVSCVPDDPSLVQTSSGVHLVPVLVSRDARTPVEGSAEPRGTAMFVPVGWKHPGPQLMAVW